MIFYSHFFRIWCKRTAFNYSFFRVILMKSVFYLVVCGKFFNVILKAMEILCFRINGGAIETHINFFFASLLIALSSLLNFIFC